MSAFSRSSAVRQLLQPFGIRGSFGYEALAIGIAHDYTANFIPVAAPRA